MKGQEDMDITINKHERDSVDAQTSRKYECLEDHQGKVYEF